ncbi:MAG: DUF6531 domain-containing protein, partial [Planctomycetota bacterium]
MATITGTYPLKSTDTTKTSIDPINMLSGNMEFTETDIVAPCPGIPLEFKRYYNSRQSSLTSLGRGWSHSYDWTISELNLVYGPSNNPPTNVWKDVRTGDGFHYYFQVLSNGTYGACYDNNSTLAAVTNGYQLTFPAGLVYAFDSTGRLASISEPWGNSLALTYSNVSGNILLSTVAHNNGQQLGFSYKNGTRLATVTSPSTNLSVSFNYFNNDTNQVTQATLQTTAGAFSTTYNYVLNQEVAFTWLISQRINKLGQTSVYGYPTNGMQTCTNLAVGGDYYRHTVEYVSTNRTVLTYHRTSGSNQVYEYLFDHDTARLSEIPGPHSATGIVTRGVRYLHDTAGNATNQVVYDTSAGESNVVVMLFDSLRNVTNSGFGYCTTPVNLWATEWNTNWNVPTSATDPEGGKVVIDYTNASVSRLKVYYDASNSWDTTFSYSSNGLLSAVTNANGTWVRYLHDNYGFTTSVVPAAGPRIAYGYTQLGFVTNVTLPGDSGPRVTSLDVNELGWVKSIAYPNGASESFLFDAMGNVTNHVDPAGRLTRYSYLPDRKLSSVVRSLASGGAVTNGISYDEQFTVLKLTDALARPVETYVLDIAGRAAAVTNLEGQTMSVSYGIGNRVKSVTRFDGTTVGNSYNSDGFLSSVSYPNSTNQFAYLKNGLLKTVANEQGTISNSWNMAGRLVSQTSVASVTSVVSYGYYPAGQLSNVTSIAGTNAYTLDAADRVSSLSSSFAPFAPLRFNYSYNTNNGLV